MVPVVKSYPQFSQNSASTELSDPQFGHGCRPGWLLAALAGDAVACGAALESIGSPHTSQ
jgi:hypothetical protein